MQFKQVTSNDEVKRRLKELVQNNRLSHAFLFLGREGSGALPLAIAFAQYILCENVNPASKEEVVSLFGNTVKSLIPNINDTCGSCSSCPKVRELVHPDLHFSYPALKRDSKHERVLSTDYIVEWREFIQQFPYGNSADWLNFLKEHRKAKIENPVNKQGNISAFECDDIFRKLSLKSFESNYKILIMWMPELLGKEGNKLLKLIEEPPTNTIFILVAEDEHAILPTILSRTQLVKIPALSNVELENALVEHYQVERSKATQIASVAEGNFREALQSLESQDEDLQGQVRDWLNLVLKNNVAAHLKWIDEINKIGREKQKQFLKYFIHLLEQAVRIAFLPQQHWQRIPEKERDFAVRINNMCSAAAMEEMISELNDSIYFIERNAHAKMLFHSLTIRFFHIIKDNSVILVQ